MRPLFQLLLSKLNRSKLKPDVIPVPWQSGPGTFNSQPGTFRWSKDKPRVKKKINRSTRSLRRVRVNILVTVSHCIKIVKSPLEWWMRKIRMHQCCHTFYLNPSFFTPWCFTWPTLLTGMWTGTKYSDTSLGDLSKKACCTSPDVITVVVNRFLHTCQNTTCNKRFEDVSFIRRQTSVVRSMATERREGNCFIV